MSRTEQVDRLWREYQTNVIEDWSDFVCALRELNRNA